MGREEMGVGKEWRESEAGKLVGGSGSEWQREEKGIYVSEGFWLCARRTEEAFSISLFKRSRELLFFRE